MVCPCSWFITPKGRKAWVQSRVDADLVFRQRKTEIGLFHEMEKLEPNFHSASHFLNSGNQPAESISAANSCLSLCLLLLFQRLIRIAMSSATTAGGVREVPIGLVACHPSAPPRFSVCLGKESLHLLNSYCQSCS